VGVLVFDSARRASAVALAVAYVTAACSATPIATASSESCAPTVPRSSPPPALDAAGPAHYFGNADLWVELWPDGVIDVDPRQVTSTGSLDVKFPWWREVSGTLVITAHRLDGPTGRVVADVPQGYGATGFQATGVLFPTAGCWEITGRVGNAALTFVALVRLAESTTPGPGTGGPTN
jgi:hypothetical protein